MNFATPAAFWWLALAAPIVVFYILKIRLRRVPVSTILFWRQIYEEKPPRSIWQHLRHLLSLLIQLFLLSLFVFSLTEPYFNWQTRQARKLVLVIDNSASMNATDIQPTRLAKAKQLSGQLITGLKFQDEMAIVAAGTQPQVVCGLTGHPRTLQNAVNSINPTDGPTRVNDGIALARRLIGSSANGQVIVISDGCFEGADQYLPKDTQTETPGEAASPSVQLALVGAKTGNVGITRFQARRSLLDPVGYEILAEVVNSSEEAVECRLEMELNGEVLDVVPLKLNAGGEWSHTFEKTAADGGTLTAKITRDDALPIDNQAWAILPKREIQPVTLVTEGNLFLEKVFEANPLVKLTVQKPTVPLKTTSQSVTVIHRAVPAKLPAGNVLVIDPTGGCDLWQLGDKLQNPIVTKQDKDSPLMAHVRLDNVLMPEAHKLTFIPPDSFQVLVSALGGEPLFAALDRPEGKVAVLTVNLDEGDLPLRTVFPIMTSNTLSWFAGNRGELRESLATGAVTDIKLSQSGIAAEVAQQPLLLRDPHGQTRPLPEKTDKVTIGPLDQCGVWGIIPAPPMENGKPKPGTDVTKTPPVLEIACNLANRAETDIRPAQVLIDKASNSPALRGAGLRPIWYYLLVLAWILSAVEWVMYQRRWIS